MGKVEEEEREVPFLFVEHLGESVSCEALFGNMVPSCSAVLCALSLPLSH